MTLTFQKLVEGISQKKALSQIFLVEDFVVRILNSSMHKTPLSQIIGYDGLFTIEIARCQEKMWHDAKPVDPMVEPLAAPALRFRQFAGIGMRIAWIVRMPRVFLW